MPNHVIVGMPVIDRVAFQDLHDRLYHGRVRTRPGTRACGIRSYPPEPVLSGGLEVPSGSLTIVTEGWEPSVGIETYIPTLTGSASFDGFEPLVDESTSGSNEDVLPPPGYATITGILIDRIRIKRGR